MTAVARATKQQPAQAGGIDGLAAALRPHGFHCVRHCKLPGARKGTVDHVVVGPSGIWVVHELADEVRDVDVRAVREHAAAVHQALACRAPCPVLSVGVAALPGGADERDGVVIIGSNRTADLLRNAALALRPEGVERLATKARAAAAPAAPAKTAKATRRWPKRVLVVVVLGLLVVGGAVGATTLLRETDDEGAAPELEVYATDAASTIRFECTTPGAGWTAIAEWPALGEARRVEWSSAEDGPWTPSTPFGPLAALDGVAPSSPTIVRIERVVAEGEVVPSQTRVPAPAAPC